MRVLLATDGSAQAAIAMQLVGAINWPPQSTIRIVTAVDPAAALTGIPLGPAVSAPADALADEAIEGATDVLDAAHTELASTGAEIEQALFRLRPASAIVEEAKTWGAELIVLGSRGHGQIASMVLGSVSAEVVDHAPCPVLVARRTTLSRAILAHDGSDSAMDGEKLVAAWPIFDGLPVEVVTVVPPTPRWDFDMGHPVYASSLDVSRGPATETQIADSDLAEASERRLRNAGREVASSVVVGDPATALITVAQERGADLIVIGTRGQTGLRRLLVGSVARNVMHHAHCSVLIVR